MDNPTKQKRWPVTIGSIITVAWVGFLIIYMIVMRDHFWERSANEFGDFLAGAFAPLAFAWLVLGFWQQGQELRNSAAVLTIQTKELAAAVRHQEKSANLASEQLKLEQKRDEAALAERIRSAQPILHIRREDRTRQGKKYVYKWGILNSGQTCTNLIIILGDVHIETTFVRILSGGQTAEFSIGFDPENPVAQPLKLIFTDARGVNQIKNYRVEPFEGEIAVFEDETDDEEEGD